MITTMRPSLKEAIPMSDAQFGLLTTSFLVIYGLLSPFAGFLADRFGRARLIIISFSAWSAITWLTGHARTYDELLATRLLLGASEAAFMPAALALISDYHTGGTRSFAIGILLSGVMAGSGAGGVGGWLADHHGWAFGFKLFGVVGVIFAVAVGCMLRDAPPPPTTPGTRPGRPPGIGVIQTGRHLFSSGSFVLLLVYWGLFSISGWAVVGWMPTYFQEHFQLTQAAAGLKSTIYANAAALLGLLVGGFWSDRWNRTDRRGCIFVSIVGLGLAIPAIMLVAYTGSLSIAIIGLMVFGLTTAFGNNEMMPMLCLICAPQYRATGFGVINLFGCLVGGAAIFAGGVLRDAQVNLRILFWGGAAGMAVCAVLLLLVRPRECT